MRLHAEPGEEGRYNRPSRGGVGAQRYRGFPNMFIIDVVRHELTTDSKLHLF